MRLSRLLSRFIPPQVVRFLGRIQFKVPALKPVLRWASAGLTRGESVMLHGVGKGLKFDSQGGHPGFALGTSDPLEQAVLAKYLKPGGVFYDIGANVGFFSTLGGRLTGEQGSVYAFEPFPQTAKIARENAARNGFTHITVFEAAVCDRDGIDEFVLSSAATNYHLPRPGETASSSNRRLKVETVTLDHLIASGKTKPPTLVMIDAEGAELAVLRGMVETIRRHNPVIVCEVHWLPPSEFIESCQEIFGGPQVYDIARLDGKAIPTAPERFHLLLSPVSNSQTLEPVDRLSSIAWRQ